MSQIIAKQNETNINEPTIIISNNREYERNKTMVPKIHVKYKGHDFTN